MNRAVSPQLAESTSGQAQGTSVLLVPVGSIEQHGPHLPLDSDTVIAVAVCNAAAARLTHHGEHVRVAPALCFGSSGEHQSFAGTISIGTEALRLVVVELVRSARCWAQRVVLVNAHGGNHAALGQAVDQLVGEGHDVAWLPCATEAVDLHAGRTETSLLLHLRPASVRLDLAEPGDPRPLTAILPAMIEGGIAAVSSNGVLGDPTGATAREGSQVFLEMVDKVACLVRAGVSVPA